MSLRILVLVLNRSLGAVDSTVWLQSRQNGDEESSDRSTLALLFVCVCVSIKQGRFYIETRLTFHIVRRYYSD